MRTHPVVMCAFARMTDDGAASPSRVRSWLYVVVQFSCLAGIAITGPLISVNGPLCAIEVLGFGLGLWAIVAMRPGNFNIIPEVVPGGHLEVQGPYRYIRHPMYAAVLLVSLPLVIDSFTFVRLVIWVILCVDLILKLRYEEALLVRQFPNYAPYQMRTKRLVPGIW